jgi:hypothetical protein
MVKIEKVEGVPMITEYSVTILLKDIPHTEYFHDQQQVKNVLDKLDKLGKKYILSATLHPVH